MGDIETVESHMPESVQYISSIVVKDVTAKARTKLQSFSGEKKTNRVSTLPRAQASGVDSVWALAAEVEEAEIDTLQACL
jgi:hypothetical protein